MFAFVAFAAGARRRAFAQSLRKSAFRTVVRRETGKLFSRLRQRPLGSHEAASSDPSGPQRLASISSSRAMHAKNLREKRAFIFLCLLRGDVPAAASPSRAALPRPTDAEAWRQAAKIFFAKVLTPEKSVIRFRPSRTSLRKQVSRVIAIKRTTKRPTARTLAKQYAGFASPEKNLERFHPNTRAASAAGVRVCVEGRFDAPTESVAARLARRRLPSGPTPAAFFVLGF